MTKPLRLTMCAKVRYVSEDLAKAASRAFEDEYRRPYRVYRCRRCRGWHLTTQIQRAAAPAEEERDGA